jgi:hypothetical protein
MVEPHQRRRLYHGPNATSGSYPCEFCMAVPRQYSRQRIGRGSNYPAQHVGGRIDEQLADSLNRLFNTHCEAGSPLRTCPSRSLTPSLRFRSWPIGRGVHHVLRDVLRARPALPHSAGTSTLAYPRENLRTSTAATACPSRSPRCRVPNHRNSLGDNGHSQACAAMGQQPFRCHLTV